MPPAAKKAKYTAPATRSKGKGKQNTVTPPPPNSPLPPPRAESQPWGCEDGPLPSEDDEEVIGNTPILSSRARNASTPHWAAWQDRLLAQQALILQPFLKPSRQVKAAWESFSETLLQESSKLGPLSVIERSGDSCRSRFERLVKFQRVCYLFLLTGG